MTTPCGACKVQRRRCGLECLMSAYFPAEHIQRFACVHHVFGAGNVANMLRTTKQELRGHVVNTLAYQAEARVRDPVYGCVGLIWELEESLRRVKEDLWKAQAELAQYIGPEFVRQMSPSYRCGPSLKRKAVALPPRTPPPRLELGGGVWFPIDVDDIENWDPFPPWDHNAIAHPSAIFFTREG
ncbi:hypothetical protein VNO78_26714 [Psophocarpus tetragonolobus]|uniref:LOB domain-containing protein n=1 Tax=Psophocarpus tetragonolobus TaxID=3891 RepID=A0AAN9RZP8_PSOTE